MCFPLTVWYNHINSYCYPVNLHWIRPFPFELTRSFSIGLSCSKPAAEGAAVPVVSIRKIGDLVFFYATGVKSKNGVFNTTRKSRATGGVQFFWLTGRSSILACYWVVEVVRLFISVERDVVRRIPSNHKPLAVIFWRQRGDAIEPKRKWTLEHYSFSLSLFLCVRVEGEMISQNPIRSSWGDREGGKKRKRIDQERSLSLPHGRASVRRRASNSMDVGNEGWWKCIWQTRNGRISLAGSLASLRRLLGS